MNIKQPHLLAELLPPRVVGGLVIVLVAAGCATSQSEPVNPSRYRIIPAPESQTAFLATARGFQWIDDNRLLFVANDKQLSEMDRRGGQLVVTKAIPTVHLWDVEDEMLRRYRDEPLSNHLCAIDGKVWYGLRLAGGEAVFEGPFSEEVERAPTPPRTRADGSRVFPLINRFTCKEYWFDDVPRLNGGRAFPLREGDGIFERLGSDRNGRPRWEGPLPPFKRWIHKEGRSKQVELPQESIGGPLGYSPLAGGYIFARDDWRLERGMVNRLYLLLANDGSVRVMDIPGSANWTRLFNYSITRQGLLAVSRAPSTSRGEWDPGPAGLYLFSGALVESFMGIRPSSQGVTEKPNEHPVKIERIARGIVDAVSSVSPDGCKVAVVIDPYDQERRKIELQVIDFCRKGA